MCIRDSDHRVARPPGRIAAVKHPPGQVDTRNHGIAFQAVSYTHLDVYKRQLADGIDQERMKRLRNGVRWTVYSPGSTAGVPLNILGSLKAPATGADLEIMRDEIEGFASSILGLAGIEADPLSSREHILLSNLVERLFRDARLYPIGGGTREIMNEIISKVEGY